MLLAKNSDLRIDRARRPPACVRTVRKSGRRADAAAAGDRTDSASLAGAAVEARDLAAVDDVGIERIGRDVAVLLDADRVPVAKRDRAVVAAAGDAGRSALLLAAAHAVRERVVGVDVVELRRRLVVPGAPRLAAVERDDRALVAASSMMSGLSGLIQPF